MQDSAYKEMDELQKTHWWYLGRRRVVSTLFNKYFTKVNGDPFLDIGCGTGEGARIVGNAGQLTGLDESTVALSLAKGRGYAELREGSVQHMPFQENYFRGALALDVLEHVEDDQGALNECYRVLKPGSVLLLTVPAYQWLWSKHDEQFAHKRRYLKGSVLKKLEESGFEIVFASYYGTLLFLAGVLFNLIFRRFIHKKVENFFPMPEALNAFLYFIFSIEAPLLRLGLTAPFGSSIIVVARKK